MFRKTKVCSGLMLAFGGTLVLSSANVLAQQQLERVEITGSAIKRIDAETAVPVTVLKMDDLKKEGVTSIQQVIQRLSSSTSSTTTSQVVGAGTGGASFADLRGIGSDKTLLLLNGRRVANNALNGSAADLNMIPFAALERIEVLRDGASALYGTDAIGGVINFITRKSYTEGEISINANAPQASGGKTRGINAAVGFGDLDTNGYNVMGVLDYQKTDNINSQQRSFGSTSYIPSRGIDGTSGTTFPANYSQRQQTGVDADGNPVFTTFNANPTFPGCAPVGNGGSINTGASATNCRYDPTPYQDLTPSTERASLFTRGSLKLGDAHTLSAEYFITKNNVYSAIGPVPQTGLTMTSDSPFFPGNGITPAPTNFTIDPTQPIGVAWRNTEAGGRKGKNENTSQRFILALEGNVVGWDYSVGGMYNENKLIENLVGGYSNDSRIAAGIADGILNPFGEQDAAGAAYLQDSALRGRLQEAKGKVTSFDARVSRELGDWFGAGTPAAIALGGEFRREKFFDDINAEVASQAGSTGVDPDSDVSGKRKVTAFYGELSVPLLKTLEASVAVRHDRYDDFGNTTNPKFGLRFQPVPEFLARATYSTGFRAPSLYELYQPNFLTFSSNSYDDPVLCPGGVPTPQADAGRDCNQQFIQQGGGNPNLKPEKAKNFTLGFVVEPIKDLTLTADLWWIRLKNSIAQFPEQVIFADPVTYANRFVRNPDGSLDYFIATLDNLGKTQTNGIDLSANYRYRMGASGTLNFGFNGTWVDKYKYQREIDGPFVPNVGKFVDNGVIFRWKHSLTVAYELNNWSIGVNNRYSSGYDDENFVEEQFLNKVGSYTLWDLFGSYAPTKAITISAGVTNLFDTDPPFTNQGVTFQKGYDPRYTDPLGRAFYARLSYKFK